MVERLSPVVWSPGRLVGHLERSHTTSGGGSHILGFSTHQERLVFLQAPAPQKKRCDSLAWILQSATGWPVPSNLDDKVAGYSRPLASFVGNPCSRMLSIVVRIQACAGDTDRGLSQNVLLPGFKYTIKTLMKELKLKELLMTALQN
jgi:hypothetical protein